MAAALVAWGYTVSSTDDAAGGARHAIGRAACRRLLVDRGVIAADLAAWSAARAADARQTPLVLLSRAADEAKSIGSDESSASAILAPPFQLRALRCGDPRGSQGVRMTGQRPLLLVVDDEQGILDVVGRFARRAGFDVVACSGGHEAIAQMQVAARRSGDGRSAHARRRRARRPAGDPRDRSALPGGADDRLRLGRHRGRGDQARRDGLSEQAARLRAARAAARRRARGARAAPQPAVDGRRPGQAARVRRHDRPRAGDAGAVRDDSPARAARAHGAGHAARPAPARSSSRARCTGPDRAATAAS